MTMTWQKGVAMAVHGLGVGLVASVKIVRVFLGFLGDVTDEMAGSGKPAGGRRSNEGSNVFLRDFDPYDPIDANAPDAETRATLSGKYLEWYGSPARFRGTDDLDLN